MATSAFRYGMFGLLAVAGMGLTIRSAQAVPMFARQTGFECQACHVGSFGPQLTATGRAFKLGGYTMGGATIDPRNHLSAMAYGGFTTANQAIPAGTGPIQAPPQNRFAGNDTWTLDQASVFYGGALGEHLGMMGQATYADPARQFHWDNTDIRYADTAQLAGRDLIWGLTVNNNPTVQDVWNTTPAWGFPYLAPTLANTPGYSPMVMGAQAQKVIGAGVYAQWNDLLYVELADYTGLGSGFQRTMGMMGPDGSGRVSVYNPYWRLTLQHDFDGVHYVALGAYGMTFHQAPGMQSPDTGLGAWNTRAFGMDTYADKALDLTYQATLDGGEHIISAYGTVIREDMRLDSSYGQGNADNNADRTTTWRGNASYSYHNTYGLTVARTVTLGPVDATLFGTQSGKPDSAYWTYQIDYSPFGASESPLFPDVNARLFLQYIAYDKFNGAKQNYDGTGRNASDNNTLYGGVWLAF